MAARTGGVRGGVRVYDSAVRGPAGRSSPGQPGGGKSGLHRMRWWVTPTVRGGRGHGSAAAEGPGQCNRKIPPASVVRCPLPEKTKSSLSFLTTDNGQRTTDAGKGEMVGGRKPLNVRAHQQPGDRLARQTPPGARPNMRAGSIRPVTTLG